MFTWREDGHRKPLQRLGRRAPHSPQQLRSAGQQRRWEPQDAHYKFHSLPGQPGAVHPLRAVCSRRGLISTSHLLPPHSVLRCGRGRGRVASWGPEDQGVWSDREKPGCPGGGEQRALLETLPATVPMWTACHRSLPLQAGGGSHTRWCHLWQAMDVKELRH